MSIGFGMSGIMGILTGGILLAHYAHSNLSHVSQVSSGQCFKAVGYLTETFVFFYLGTALTTFNHSWDGLTVLVTIILTLVSRCDSSTCYFSSLTENDCVHISGNSCVCFSSNVYSPLLLAR